MSEKRKKRVMDINRCFKLHNHFPRNILEIGFGNGEVSEYYARKGQVVGIEVNREMVDKATAKIPNAQFFWYDGIQIPFNDSRFDTIIMNDVLEHIPYDRMELLLPEIKRTLKPNGLIYISVMNRWQLIEPHKLIPLLTWLPKRAWHPMCRKIKGTNYLLYFPYTRKRIQKLFRDHNLLYRDMTNIYVTNKFMGINPIGSRTTSKIHSTLRKFHLLNIAYCLGLKVSVLLYLAWEHQFKEK